MGKGSKMLACIYKPLGWFPVIMINAIAVWSYFAYVVILCFDTVTTPLERVLYLVFYHPFFILFMYSYWKTILSSPGIVPRQYHMTKDDIDKYESSDSPQDVLNDLATELPLRTFANNKNARFCEQCFIIKPDRSHHCSMCGRCILKMDHHCPWVNNCVGWGNYKYFVLFLFYSILYTMYVAATSARYFIKFWSSHSSQQAGSGLHILFLFFVSAMFSISLWSLFGFHLFLVSKNRTTLESFRAANFHYGPDKDGFNLGKVNNFRQVFGNVRWKWIVPTFSTLGNGCVFLTSSAASGETTGLLMSRDHEDEEFLRHPSSDSDGAIEDETSVVYTSGGRPDVNLNLSGFQTDSENEDIFDKTVMN